MHTPTLNRTECCGTKRFLLSRTYVHAQTCTLCPVYTVHVYVHAHTASHSLLTTYCHDTHCPHRLYIYSTQSTTCHLHTVGRNNPQHSLQCAVQYVMRRCMLFTHCLIFCFIFGAVHKYPHYKHIY